VASDSIHIVLKDITLLGRLHSPGQPKGLVIAAEKEDCKLLKTENEYLSKALKKRNIATLFTHLLEPPENQDFDIPFDIEVMGQHIRQLTEWLSRHRSLGKLPLGYFAVKTAAAAIMEASIAASKKIRAMVCLCGRPDLAGPRLSLIRPPTLLITGSENVYLTELNWQAYEQLTCEKQLVVIEGDPGYFEEADKARQIAHLSANWFDRHFPNATANYPKAVIDHSSL
jgi:putative phosphoribosyl transferase